MKFDELDRKMRIYETAHDHCVLPGLHMVARLDGRTFTRLTKDKHSFEVPFDSVFRDYMVETVRHLMSAAGFRILYGYTQSDEISFWFHPDETVFKRKLRKLNSILAAEASAKFSLLLGDLAAFDCRISQLPALDLVEDYFRWRAQDALRNALNSHCYWLLRKTGQSVRSATDALDKLSVADKNELLFQHGINFNDLPNWQKRGSGLYWEQVEKQGYNPITNEHVTTTRRRLKIDFDLPMKEAYSACLRQLIRGESGRIEGS